jgi:DNA-binding NarL/FixJ family response regulator
MSPQGINLFIVDDNVLMVTGLRNFLNSKFGNSIKISTFLNGESAVKKIDANTNIVILDYFLPGENGNDVLVSIKKINPKTEVIMLTSNEDIGIAIDSFRKGATDYVIKGGKSWKKITSLVYNIVTYPVRILVREFGISKYLAIFLLTFVLLGIGVYTTLWFIG